MPSVGFGEVLPAVNQIEINPFYQQDNALAINENHGVQVQGWTPFAEGQHGIFNSEALHEIGHKYNKTAAQVILRWLVQRNIVPLAKTINKERMIENINIFDFSLSSDNMAKIKLLDTNRS
ncbi:aldo/keto reductase [Vagococcus elongatus]|uniref:NADP-dependent oxidoreductase domain-containing protein n=1 Tax=Vagococcus elongatus TaxID=180344 RepID=A0A430ANQ9_9ENTE|nr:aldo/keto reductase [Vagococcus elongatus]RSU09554.1 hypothetical protein CBF29_11150 [Vagococcus elongatus]